MALSAETEAIIERLKAEGDLIRNSGTNSVRSVNIKLEKFEGLFESINENLIEQTNILTSQLSKSQQKARQEETRRQYEELTPPASSGENASSGGRDAIESRITSTIDSKMKEFSLLGSIKNIALGAAGLFIGYNFLKGAIDEATGGGFTKFESGIANFGTQLGKMDLPNISSTLGELNKSISGLTAEFDRIKKQMEDFNISNLLWALGAAFTGLSTLLTGVRLWALRKQKASEKRIQKMLDEFAEWVDDLKKNPNPDATTPIKPKTPSLEADAPPTMPDGSKPPAIPPTPMMPEGQGPGSAPEVETTPYKQPKPKKTPKPKPGNALGKIFSLAPDVNMNDPAVKGMVREDFLNKFGDKGFSTNSAGRIIGKDGKFKADQKLLDDLANSLDPKYSKWFKRVVKGLGVIGVGFTIYEAYILYGLLNSDAPDDVKEDAIVNFIGSFIGAAALGTAAAIAGAPFGGWTGLITGIIGAGLGAFAGPMVARYIWEWVKGNEPSTAQLKGIESQQFRDMTGMSQQEIIDYYSNQGPVALDPYGQYYGGNSTGSLGSLGGGNSTQSLQNDIENFLNPMSSPRRGYESGLDTQQSLPSYMQKASFITGGRSRAAMLKQAGNGAGSGGTVVINAPTNVSPTINNVEGGKSVSHVQVANFGGMGGGNSDDPYNLAFV